MPATLLACLMLGCSSSTSAPADHSSTRADAAARLESKADSTESDLALDQHDQSSRDDARLPHRIAEAWDVVVRNEPSALDELIRGLGLLTTSELRLTTYTVADQYGDVFVVDGAHFEVPSDHRAWADSLIADLSALPPDQQADFLIRLDALYAGIMESWPTIQSSWRQHDNALDGTTMRGELGSGPVEFFVGTPWVYQDAAMMRTWINSELVKLVEDAPAAKAYEPAERQKLLRRIARSNEFYREDPIP